LLKYFPYEDFIIYELGAGNGTLARNILDFLADEHPEVYERTQYHIVEISEALTTIQKKRLLPHHPCVNVTHRSIFDWSKPEYAPCFVLALEVAVSSQSNNLNRSHASKG
jgi:SAM-dependent MidA family methyltransferase